MIRRICNSCNNAITAGLAHVVLPMPLPAGDQHYHLACWELLESDPPRVETELVEGALAEREDAAAA